MDTKALQEALQSLDFTPSLAKPEMERSLGDEGPPQKRQGEVSQIDWYGRLKGLREESRMKLGRGGREAAGDGANIKPLGRGVSFWLSW